ncbi:porin [Paraburkholderia bannensis]|uniref:porin n=1 Tax=Paraburkholderia bannensis TaxID=765414 RepID=UPI002AC34239|nr:porin [Paraburkholderia bannensis]
MRRIISVAALATFASVCHAQGSVTLYGRLDAGLEYVSGLQNSNGASSSRFRVEGGNWGSSYWGMQGEEPLADGLKAIFHLEEYFSVVNGQLGTANTIFDNWAAVGLADDKYGTVLLGRQSWIANGIWDFDPLGQSNWSSASLVRGRNWPQASNVVSYQSPKLAGFDVYGQYALSNSTSFNGNGTTSQGRADGLQLTYTSSLFQVRGIYDEIRDSSNGQLDNPFTASREYTAALNVFLAPFKLMAGYEASRTSGMRNVAIGSPTTTDFAWAGVTWTINPVATLSAAAYHVNANNGGGNATLYTIGGTYNLSKRTLLDFQIATVQNSRTANFGLDPNSEGPGGIQSDGSYNENPLPGHAQSGAYIGIQHLF